MSNYQYSTGAKRPRWGSEKARGRKSQGANRQRGKKLDTNHSISNTAKQLQQTAKQITQSKSGSIINRYLGTVEISNNWSIRPH